MVPIVCPIPPPLTPARPRLGNFDAECANAGTRRPQSVFFLELSAWRTSHLSEPKRFEVSCSARDASQGWLSRWPYILAHSPIRCTSATVFQTAADYYRGNLSLDNVTLAAGDTVTRYTISHFEIRFRTKPTRPPRSGGGRLRVVSRRLLPGVMRMGCRML